MNTKIKLTKSEENLMEIFWDANIPLTSVQILKVKDNIHEWNDSYIHNMLRSIQRKGIIKTCGMVQYGTQYARQFVPMYSREEYAAQLALGTGIGSDSIAKVAVAMAEQTGLDKDVITVLEDIINSLKDKASKDKET